MKILSYTTVRSILARAMQQVCEDHEPVIVTRKNNSPVVMLSLEDYESLNETAYLMKSPANAARLKKAVQQLEKGHGKKRELAE